MTTTVVPGLLEQLRHLPDDAFTRLQYLAPQVGCFNGCAMCSQGAGRDTWSLTREGLTGLFTALAKVAAERSRPSPRAVSTAPAWSSPTWTTTSAPTPTSTTTPSSPVMSWA
ncbi:hypothetical protein SAMN04490356_4372 [Streptomyces melanosporofaciens]|uniref:Uncharacterized protein n=1 Tax=Streptomyces melanosporofaciens TaxID=67327 RepID=A0A1H4T0H3_STRMJ|nr:hypothetical protein SAMN04490356_4372 [Streptomyces melanosporofaciens]